MSTDVVIGRSCKKSSQKVRYTIMTMTSVISDSYGPSFDISVDAFGDLLVVNVYVVGTSVVYVVKWTMGADDVMSSTDVGDHSSGSVHVIPIV